jgi:hypothetical protein
MFTSLHLFANFRAVRAIVMESLNQARLHVLVENFLAFDGYIMSVKDVNCREPVLWSMYIMYMYCISNKFRTNYIHSTVKEEICVEKVS